MDTANCSILSCPAEIIQEIFKYVVLSRKPRGDRAAILSHVCQAWREIALTTPSLWAEIRLNLDLPRSILDEYWAEMVTRAQNMPLEVILLPGQESFTDSLPDDFEEVENIDKITFAFPFFTHADLGERFSELLTDGFPTLRSPVRRFHLMYIQLTPIQEVWELNEWMQGWESINELVIYTTAVVELEGAGPFPHIKQLTLTAKGATDFYTIIEAFPNLERLDLSKVRPLPQNRPRSPKVMPFLETIKINGETEKTWSSISCPKLTTLSVPESDDSSAFYTFLKTHTSLQRLELEWQDAEFLRKLSSSASHIKVLVVRGGIGYETFEGLDGFYDSKQSEPVFPNLEHLIVKDDSNLVTTKQFESLVAARFLPAGHPDSRMAKGINLPIRLLTFTIEIDPEDKKGIQWLPSHLLKSAKSMQDSRDDGLVSYEMRWSD